MLKALHPRDGIDFMSQGKREVEGIEHCRDTSIKSLMYLKKSQGRLITAASNSSGNIRPGRKVTKIRKQKREEK